MTRRAALAVLLAGLCVTSAVIAAPPQAKLRPGIYSNLRYNSEGGDLLGDEVLLVPADGASDATSWQFVMQHSEGGLPCVFIASVTERSGSIKVSAPKESGCAPLQFIVTWGADDIVIRWETGDKDHLKRGKSYWQ